MKALILAAALVIPAAAVPEAVRFQTVPLFVPMDEAGMYSVQVLVAPVGTFLAYVCFSALGTVMRRDLFEYRLVPEAQCLFVDPAGVAVFAKVPVYEPVQS